MNRVRGGGMPEMVVIFPGQGGVEYPVQLCGCLRIAGLPARKQANSGRKSKPFRRRWRISR